MASEEPVEGLLRLKGDASSIGLGVSSESLEYSGNLRLEDIVGYVEGVISRYSEALEVELAGSDQPLNSIT
jgi:hypothetical protein